METRLAKLEEFAIDTRARLAKIEARLELMATKADLAEKVDGLKVEMHKGFADMIKWVVGTAIILGATALTVITFVLNHASPKAQSLQAPINIYTQPAQSTATPPPSQLAPPVKP